MSYITFCYVIISYGFQKQPPLFLKVSQIAEKNPYVGVCFFSLKLYKEICSGKWFMKISKKTFISQQTYLYVYGSQTV